MRHNKSTTFLSELQTYFTSEEKIIQTLYSELSSLKFLTSIFQSFDKANTQYLSYHRFIMLMLFPFFSVKDIAAYGQSCLYQLLNCGKDSFYRLLNNTEIDWRKISYKINCRLLKKVKNSSYDDDNQPIRCLIVDDTDLPKSGKKFEFLSRIHSHVHTIFRYGFKGLFLGYHDGKSFFCLDFSLHGEKGDEKKKNYKPYGLTDKQQKSRFKNKNRTQDSSSKTRESEYFKKKTEQLISLIINAIANGIRFDYLLVDSWFTSFDLVHFIKSRRIGCHFLGMVKRGNTNYLFNGKELTFNEILHILKHSKKMSYDKKLRIRFYEARVELKGIEVKLFFSKTSKRGKWHGLVTTNRELGFSQAFKIYATRWSIEVFFKEAKQLLGLGKCESRHFEAQIAATTLCILQYNLLSTVKRFESYETLGALFRGTKAELIEITVKERIWLIIIELLTELSEFMEFELQEVLMHIFTDNQKFTKFINLKHYMQAA